MKNFKNTEKKGDVKRCRTEEISSKIKQNEGSEYLKGSDRTDGVCINLIIDLIF